MSLQAVGPDLLGLLGTLVLIRPAVRLNGLARRRARLASARRKLTKQDDPELSQDIADAEKDLESLQAQWNRWDEAALAGGVGLLALAYLLSAAGKL